MAAIQGAQGQGQGKPRGGEPGGALLKMADHKAVPWEWKLVTSSLL